MLYVFVPYFIFSLIMNEMKGKLFIPNNPISVIFLLVLAFMAWMVIDQIKNGDKYQKKAEEEAHYIYERAYKLYGKSREDFTQYGAFLNFAYDEHSYDIVCQFSTKLGLVRFAIERWHAEHPECDLRPIYV